MPIVKINQGTPHERIIGTLDTKNKVFSKKVSKSKHLFRVLDAWGVDSDYFTDVLLPNNYTIRVYDKDEGITYEVSAEKFAKKGEYYHFKQEREDHRSQIFLSLRHWDKLEPERLSPKELFLKYFV